MLSTTSSNHPRIALVDGNNFYVSCERAFAPKLIGKPVIVLSNNDGCTVSRSQEAKELGVKMGEPFFKISKDIHRQGLIALSSNYTLYADLSNRMMKVMGKITPSQEVYSIDESFLDLSHLTADGAIATARQMRQKVLQCVGIPTCIGIGPSKTLAKLANHIAKKNIIRNTEGVFSWEQLFPEARDALLSKIPVGEVWGVGRRLSDQLEYMGIRTAHDLRKANRKAITKRFSIVLGKTVDELNGIACLGLDDVTPDKQTIMTSRSFGNTVPDIDSLAAAISEFASKSAEKLRRQGCVAHGVYVFVQTDRFANEPQYNPGLTIPLSVATDDTLRINRAALYGLKHFFRCGFNYKKAGVMLSGIEKRCCNKQQELFAKFDEAKSSRLMAVMDGVNRKFGSGALRLANTTGRLAGNSAMRRSSKSPDYTTKWEDIPLAN